MEEVHSLSYPFAAAHNLVPTCVEWNKDGFVLAVAYGRKDVSGWCDLPGTSMCFGCLLHVTLSLASVLALHKYTNMVTLMEEAEHGHYVCL